MIWNGAKRPPTLRLGQTTRAVSLPVGGQKPHPPSPFIIITPLESWYSFYHPTEGRRLSRPRHCSKGVQPVPRLYIVVVFTINTQLPTVGFEPWSSHTAVTHVTIRPLHPAIQHCTIGITVQHPDNSRRKPTENPLKLSFLLIVVSKRHSWTIKHLKRWLWWLIKRDVVDAVRPIVVPRQNDTTNQLPPDIVLPFTWVFMHTLVTTKHNQHQNTVNA